MTPKRRDAPLTDEPSTCGSLTALYDALAEADSSPREGFSDRLVLGEGPRHPRLMLVGEQPGHEEDEVGRPFVGPAGRMLDASLAQAGIERSDVFLTNAVKRFKFSPRGKRRIHETPSARDIQHYRWWLNEEIRLVDPPVLVALGATALHALLGKRTTLRSVRDEVLPWHERALFATVHPSFLLRLRDEADRKRERAQFVSDLRKAAQYG